MAEMDFRGKSERLEISGAITTVPVGNKPPWKTKSFRLCCINPGSNGGALVAADSFRSMGQPRKAQQTVFYTLLRCIAFLIPFLLAIPADAPIKKIILLAVEGAGYSVFLSIVQEEYVKWRGSNPDVKPRNDYASIGWGIVGALLYFTMGALIAAFGR